MCRSLNRRHRTNPPRRYVAECRKEGHNRPKSRGRDRRPQGECGGLAAAPAPVPAVTSQGNGKMARQHSARWIAGPSERTAENRGISPAACRHHELPEAAIQGPWVRMYSWRWPGWLRGREQGRQEPLDSCADSWVRTIISNPSEARRLQSAGGSNRTRGRVLILPLCFWRISRSVSRES